MIPVIELLINLLIVNRYPVWICYCNLHDLYYSTTTLTVYCVNDAAVMKGWALDQKSEGTIVSMMGDPACEFTKACGMEMTHPGPPSVGIIGRCKRWAMYVEDGVCKHVAVAEGEDGTCLDFLCL